MKKLLSYATLLVSLLLMAACASMPRLKPVTEGRESALAHSCEAVFPSGKWRFIHAIRATLQGDRRAVMTGVTVMDSADRTLHSVMMTVEGLVVLDAVYKNGKLTLHRGVPPFDSKSFASGMMADIRLMFFKPDGDLEDVGMSKEGTPACRYNADPDRAVFITVQPETGDWILRQYQNHSLARTVAAHIGKPGDKGEGIAIPKRLTLTAHGHPRPYTLNLTLIEGETILDAAE